ncbi:MAG: hypothetical protein OEM29_08730 [Thermoplasmata archaeon]|nr:hypothetical protein [Thermoplasmata archaeon]
MRKGHRGGTTIHSGIVKRKMGTMICENCRLHPDCDIEPPKENETCPYYEPKQRLRLTFTEDGWKMGEV